MSQPLWHSYTALAWVEPIVETPESLVQEIELYCRYIKDQARIEVKSLLHLGCGTGLNDFTFKKHFLVTGLDISPEMLELAQQLNPEATYTRGDMRDVHLGRHFDAVAIPDSISYLTTEEDVARALETAGNHLRPGGVLLLVVHIKEEFRENNFVYQGRAGDWHVTQFENNYFPDASGTTYEATFVYLLRHRGRLRQVRSDTHIMGLFSLDTWMKLLGQAGLELRQFPMPDYYGPVMGSGGCYPLRVFLGIKPLD